MTFEEWKEKNLFVDSEGEIVEIRKNHFNGNGKGMSVSFDTFERCWTEARKGLEKISKFEKTEDINELL